MNSEQRNETALPCLTRGRREPTIIYVQCEREAGHTGKHLARSVKPWM